jgi:hypothetical protein
MQRKEAAGLSARWRWEFHIRNKKTLKREVFIEEVGNAIVDQGLDWFLDTTVGSGAAGGNSIFGGLKLAGAVDSADTLASHAGWAEFKEYSGDRKNYLPADAANGQITNATSVMTFVITSQGVVAGGFMAAGADVESKETTDQILVSASDINSSRSVDSGDTINLTVTYVASNQ